MVAEPGVAGYVKTFLRLGFLTVFVPAEGLFTEFLPGLPELPGLLGLLGLPGSIGAGFVPVVTVASETELSP